MCIRDRSFGVDVLLEPICRYEIDSIHTTDQAIDLCERAGKPANLGLLLDLFHMNIEEASVCGAICLSLIHIFAVSERAASILPRRLCRSPQHTGGPMTGCGTERYADWFFDLDGTLVDSAPDILRLLGGVLREEGLAVPKLDKGLSLIHI